ncbi:MAG: SMC-Scp complex subunit ScpB [Clostridiales bacterium]|nr:SMC-Scp complex subunit ScpB [Clostridiales bacterium]
MDIQEIESAIEGILFASGDPVSIDKLCTVLEIDRVDMDKIVQNLSDYFRFNRRGIQLIRLENSLQLCTRPEYADVIRKALETRRQPMLSNAALEVLSIIAYRQPITRAYIEQVRGVDSSGTVSNLLEKELIEECGKLDVPGRPTLFRTTPTFLRAFGISSVEELPDFSGIDGEEGDQLSLLFSTQQVDG